MSELIYIKPEKRGGFGIYRDDILLIFNLDNNDVIAFTREHKSFGMDVVDESSANFETLASSASARLARKTGPGRELILGPYLQVVTGMLDRNPRTTAKDVEIHLRGIGARFTSITAVTNLARKHGLKLAA